MSTWHIFIVDILSHPTNSAHVIHTTSETKGDAENSDVVIVADTLTGIEVLGYHTLAEIPPNAHNRSQCQCTLTWHMLTLVSRTAIKVCIIHMYVCIVINHTSGSTPKSGTIIDVF